MYWDGTLFIPMKIPHLVAKKKKKMDEAVSGISYILKQLFIVSFQF